MLPCLSHHQGAWSGSNGFRLMPEDPMFTAPASANVAAAAGANLLVVTYTWAHPDDGSQEGLVVVGRAEDSEGLTAFWGDSWHQQPAPRTLAGSGVGETIQLTCTYAGDWQWQITLDGSDPHILRLQMSNIVPASAASDDLSAGGYLAMDAELRR